MNIERLKYMFEVSKTGSISEAAQNLHVTQSALSQAITSVEEELGVKLFSRDRQGTLLTFEGKNLISTLKELLDKYEELKEKANIYQDEIRGNLNIATIPGLMSFILKVFSSFKIEHPNVHLNITEKGSKEIVEDVKNQKYDIGLINFHHNFLSQINDIKSEVILNSHIYLCVSKNSHLTTKKHVTLEDLKDENIVLYNDDYITSFADKLNKTMPLNILFVTENVNAILVAVIEDLAITFATDISIKELNYFNGQIVSIPLDSISSPSVPFGWIRSNNASSSLMIDKFTSQLKTELKLLNRINN